jgi:hypothetical protein
MDYDTDGIFLGIFTFLVVEITPVSINNIAWRTYIYFAVFNAAFIPIIYYFYPETQDLSLEQIDKLFTGDKILLHWRASMGVPGEPQIQGSQSSVITEKENVELSQIDRVA